MPRTLIFLAAMAGAVVLGVSAARAVDANYVEYKTWLPNWDGSGWYDWNGQRWLTNIMGHKECRCTSRVTFINSAGSWSFSYSDDWFDTGTACDNCNYQKKPYCKNNDDEVYHARCYGDFSD